MILHTQAGLIGPDRKRIGARLRCSAGAFSVTELMLAIAIMGVIVYALFNVFSQTQRALRASDTQGDVSEKGRAILELITRELEQAQPIRYSRETNVLLYPDPNSLRLQGDDLTPPRTRPRTNVLYSLFFITQQTNEFKGIGYRVIPEGTNAGVGKLQRFQTTNVVVRHPMYLSNRLVTNFFMANITNDFHHIADGVVHLKFIPYDREGFRLGWDTTNKNIEGYTILRTRANGSVIAADSDVSTNKDNVNVYLHQELPNIRYETRAAFVSNAMPAFIDVELGIIEPETMRQYYTMVQDGNPAARNFLATKITKVHLFRQRIPIRTAAP